MVIENDSGRTHGEMETTSERTAELASRLAPVEEQRAGEDLAGDVTDSFKISPSLIEDNSGQRLLRPHKAVVFVLLVALGFIAFITYLIASTPTE